MEQQPRELSGKVMNHVKGQLDTPNQVHNKAESQRMNTENKILSVNLIKQYKCPICNLVCNSNDELLKHIHIHKYGSQSNQKPRKIVYAIGDTSINKYPVMNNAHVEKYNEKSASTVRGKNQYECPICHIVCKNNDVLLEHIHIHKFGKQSIHNNRQKINQTGNYKCPICRLVYETNDELLKHVYVHKFGKEPDVIEKNVKLNYSDQGQRKEYKCPICHVVCNGNKELSIHVQTHVKLPFKHKCIYCGKGFDRPSALEIHTRSHTKEKPFQCSICDKCFSTAGQLVKHMKAHVTDNYGKNSPDNLISIKANEIKDSGNSNHKNDTRINFGHEIFHDIETDSLDTVQNHTENYANINKTIGYKSFQNNDVPLKNNSQQCNDEENINLIIKQESVYENENKSVFLEENNFSEFNNYSIKIEKPDDNIYSTNTLDNTPNTQSKDTVKKNAFDHEVLAHIKQEDTVSQLLPDTNHHQLPDTMMQHQWQDTNFELIKVNIKQEDDSDNDTTYCVDGLTVADASDDKFDKSIKNEDLFSRSQESDPALSWTEPDSGGNSSLIEAASFSCHLCPIVFDEWVKLEEHIREHVTDTQPSDIYTKMDKDRIDPSKFLICSLQSDKHEEKMEHCSSSNDQVDPNNFSLFVCSLCQSRFDFKDQLKDHMTKNHGIVDTTRCPVCWKRFKDVTVLAKHLFIHTYDVKDKKKDNKVLDDEVNANIPLSKTYKCPICSEILNTNDDLLNHVTLHKKAIRKKSKYKCEYCGVGYEKPSQLKIHKRKHTGEKAYECSECGESFSYTGQLKKHLINSHLTPS